MRELFDVELNETDRPMTIEQLADAEEEAIEALLDAPGPGGGSAETLDGAAKKLGLNPGTLYSRVKKLQTITFAVVALALGTSALPAAKRSLRIESPFSDP